jgi:hypothetical protein
VVSSNAQRLNVSRGNGKKMRYNINSNMAIIVSRNCLASFGQNRPCNDAVELKEEIMDLML